MKPVGAIFALAELAPRYGKDSTHASLVSVARFEVGVLVTCM